MMARRRFGSVGFAILLLLACCSQAWAQTRSGTGFIVHEKGFLLTCAHVVRGGGPIEVRVNGRSYPGTRVAVDEKRDLALLQIAATGLPVLPLADSDGVELGEEARAIGFPLLGALDDSLKATRGSVSGFEGKDPERLIVVDTAINPGNSGGPLVNERGEVIGVVSAKLTGERVTSVGFAVPSNYARQLLKANRVAFATEGAKEKLEGPKLVKAVAPATVLIRVGTNAGDPQQQVEAVYRALKALNWEEMYHLMQFSPKLQAELPKDPKQFAAGVEKGFRESDKDGAAAMVFNSISNVRVGVPMVRGNKATLATSCQISANGRTLTFNGMANMIKVGDAWKLDLTFTDDAHEATSTGLAKLLGEPAP